MLAKCLILWIGYFAASSNAGTVPSWLTPCPPLDSKCIINALDASMPHIAKGDDVLGTPPIDPLPIKDTAANIGSLELKFRNVILHNLSKSKFEKFTRDLDKSTVSITVVCPVDITGEYYANGSLSNIKLFGDSGFSIKGGSIRTNIDMKLKTVMKNDKKHYKLASFVYKFEPISKYNIEFKNLNNGDKETAAAIATLLDGGWKEMILQFGTPIMDECMITLAKVLDKGLQAISTDQLEIA